MTNSVKFWDPYSILTEYLGRWTLTVDAFTWPAGAGSDFYEYDFALEDPGDSDRIFWLYIGSDEPLATSTVTGGFTFDSDSPPVWADYWAVFRADKTSWDGAFPLPFVYDGEDTFDVDTDPFEVDPTSDPDWWATPPSDTPTIVAPTNGSSSTIENDYVVTVDWTEASQTTYQIHTSGIYTYDTGSVSDSATTRDITIPYGASGSLTIEVRCQQTGTGWSEWASVTITITSEVDTPVDCIDDEVLLDDPAHLWLFRETDLPRTLDQVAEHDLLGSFYPLYAYIDNAKFSSSTITPDGDTAVGDLLVVFIWDLVAHGVTATISFPAGWTHILRQDQSITSPSVDRVSAIAWKTRESGETTYTYTYSEGGVSGVCFTYRGQVGGSLEVVDSTSAVGPFPFTWPGFTWDRNELQMPIIGMRGITDGTVTWSLPSHDADVYNSMAAVQRITNGFERYFDHDFGYYFNRDYDWTVGTSSTDDAVFLGVLVRWVPPADMDDIHPFYFLGRDGATCDEECEDTDGSMGIGSVNEFVQGFLGNNVFTPEGEYSVETVIRVIPQDRDNDGPGIVVALSDPFVKLEQYGRAQRLEYDTGDPYIEIPGEDCWIHVVVRYDDTLSPKRQTFVNGVVVATDNNGLSAFDFGGAVQASGAATDNEMGRIALLAYYTERLSQKRIIAHASHFCDLCHRIGKWSIGLVAF